jgi:hypothetical protein
VFFRERVVHDFARLKTLGSAVSEMLYESGPGLEMLGACTACSVVSIPSGFDSFAMIYDLVAVELPGSGKSLGTLLAWKCTRGMINDNLRKIVFLE